MSSHLSVKNLYKKYDARTVLKNINIEIQKGEVVAILGENGCGKSTLLKIMAGLENSDAGAAFLNDKKIDSPANKLVAGHQEIQLVNQQYKLNLTLNIKDNILLPIKDYEKTYQYNLLEEATSIFKLADFLNRKPNQLSGGQQQRVAIARAMVQKPEVLLLDEPFSNQDLGNKQLLKEQVLEIVKALNTTLIFVTHDAQEALSMGDKIAIMDEGKILQFDSPILVYNQPVNERTAWLTGEINSINAINAKEFFEFDTGKQTLGVRPEWISLQKSEDKEYQVRICEFYGAFNRLQIGIGQENLIVYDYTKLIEKKDFVKITFQKEKLIFW